MIEAWIHLQAQQITNKQLLHISMVVTSTTSGCSVRSPRIVWPSYVLLLIMMLCLYGHIGSDIMWMIWNLSGTILTQHWLKYWESIFWSYKCPVVYISQFEPHGNKAPVQQPIWGKEAVLPDPGHHPPHCRLIPVYLLLQLWPSALKINLWHAASTQRVGFVWLRLTTLVSPVLQWHILHLF